MIVVFYILALLSVAGAVGVVVARSTVKAALSLLVTFVAVACLYLTLEAELLAALQVLVYAGAVLVLFLFVIMLLAGGGEERGRLHLLQRLAGLGLAGAFVLLAGQFLLAGWFWPAGGPEMGYVASNTRTLAALMFTRYLLPFEVTSLLLLAAVVGAVVLAGKRRTDPWERLK
jgi:NADH-quinone oxidoreductase subunit J